MRTHAVVVDLCTSSPQHRGKVLPFVIPPKSGYGGQDAEPKSFSSRAPLQSATVPCAKSSSRVKPMGGLYQRHEGSQPLTAEPGDRIRPPAHFVRHSVANAT